MTGGAALKGLRAARLRPVLRNDKNAYETGAPIALTGARSLIKKPGRAEYALIIDDEPAETGAEYVYDELTLTLAELPAEAEAALCGASRDADTGAYVFSAPDAAPEFALSYECLTASGTYRQYRYHALRLMSASAEHRTNPGGDAAQDYRLVFRAGRRKKDGAHRSGFKNLGTG